jgi:hypothetical protein
MYTFILVLELQMRLYRAILQFHYYVCALANSFNKQVTGRELKAFSCDSIIVNITCQHARYEICKSHKFGHRTVACKG